MTTPTPLEEEAQTGRFRGESPLLIRGRTANDRSFGNQPAANLPGDSLKAHSGEGANVLEHIPGPGMEPHLLEHLPGVVLPAEVAMDRIAENELTARDAGPRLAVPNLPANGAQRTDPSSGGHFQGMIAQGQIAGTGCIL